MELLQVQHRVVSLRSGGFSVVLYGELEQQIAPACNSNLPFSTDESRAFVCAVAACAVGVDPTERTKGVLWEPVVCNSVIMDKARPAAMFTASTSADKNDFTSLDVFDA
jgi:hypothetical protein